MKRFILLALALITGCVYYNTFFNAKKYYQEAREMDLNEQGKPKSQAVQNYNKAIKKCGIVLTDYKDSKYADDALFLMARSLFYIGRNYTQAIEKLNDLINFYPDSEFIPEAKLYLARANYRFHKEEEAFRMLQKIVNDKDYEAIHPQALRLLANYHLENENYVETEFYLNKIIEDYPDSEEFEKAFILQGKAQSEAEKYEHSNEIFFELLDSRVSRKSKFDARFYIASNYLKLKQYQKAREFAEKLLADEYREEKISQTRLIQARALAELGETQESITIFKAIIEDNPRTNLSAEASFYLAETYFNNLNDYEKAIEYYNKVKEEKQNSQLVQTALTKSSVASQIIQYYNPDQNTPIKDLVEEHFKLAEYYIDILEEPDSALYVYDNIIERGENLNFRIDSLRTAIDSIDAKIDSFALIDSTMKAQKDSSFVETYGKEIEAIIAQKKDHQSEISNLNAMLEQYDSEFIPYAKFVEMWIYETMKNDNEQAAKLLDELKLKYPENKYTYAAEQFLNGENVELIDPQEVKIRERYKDALDYLENDVEQAITILKTVSADSLHQRYADKAKYALGYLYAFTIEDTARSKPYFDDIMENSDNSELKQNISAFYTNGSFRKLEKLPKIAELEKKEQEKEQKDQEKEQEKQQEQASEPENKEQTGGETEKEKTAKE